MKTSLLALLNRWNVTKTSFKEWRNPVPGALRILSIILHKKFCYILCKYYLYEFSQNNTVICIMSSYLNVPVKKAIQLKIIVVFTKWINQRFSN